MPLQTKRERSFETGMMQEADGLFDEFEELPVRMVLSAITEAWGDLRRMPDEVRPPEAIVSRARVKLAATPTEDCGSVRRAG